MAYLALIFVISIFMRLQEIRKNWPKYRCNPVYMPFADDVGIAMPLPAAVAASLKERLRHIETMLTQNCSRPMTPH